MSNFLKDTGKLDINLILGCIGCSCDDGCDCEDDDSDILDEMADAFSSGFEAGFGICRDMLIDACDATEVWRNGDYTVIGFADGSRSKVKYNPAYGYPYDEEKALMAALLKRIMGNAYITMLSDLTTARKPKKVRVSKKAISKVSNEDDILAYIYDIEDTFNDDHIIDYGEMYSNCLDYINSGRYDDVKDNPDSCPYLPDIAECEHDYQVQAYASESEAAVEIEKFAAYIPDISETGDTLAHMTYDDDVSRADDKSAACDFMPDLCDSIDHLGIVKEENDDTDSVTMVRDFLFLPDIAECDGSEVAGNSQHEEPSAGVLFMASMADVYKGRKSACG